MAREVGCEAAEAMATSSAFVTVLALKEEAVDVFSLCDHGGLYVTRGEGSR